jgi:hypothetical protein
METTMDHLPRRLPIWPGAPRAAQPRPHVPQQRGPDCAIAAAATVTGVSYDQVASVAFSLREEGLGGMRVDNMVKLLERLTDIPWRAEKKLRSWIRLGDMTFPGELVVACIVDPWLIRGAHAIVARDQTVYDGSLDEPVSPRDHPRRKWYISWLVISGV